MKIINVSESVWICQDKNYYLVNSVCVNLGSELLFIDTGINSIVANKFRKEMQKINNLKKGILTITRANNDHFLGLEAFLDLPVVVSDKFMKSLIIRIFQSILNQILIIGLENELNKFTKE